MKYVGVGIEERGQSAAPNPMKRRNSDESDIRLEGPLQKSSGLWCCEVPLTSVNEKAVGYGLWCFPSKAGWS